MPGSTRHTVLYLCSIVQLPSCNSIWVQSILICKKKRSIENWPNWFLNISFQLFFSFAGFLNWTLLIWSACYVRKWRFQNNEVIFLKSQSLKILNFGFSSFLFVFLSLTRSIFCRCPHCLGGFGNKKVGRLLDYLF